MGSGVGVGVGVGAGVGVTMVVMVTGGGSGTCLVEMTMITEASPARLTTRATTRMGTQGRRGLPSSGASLRQGASDASKKRDTAVSCLFGREPG